MNDITSLVLIGSEIGIQDALSQLGRWSKSVQTHQIRMGSKAAVVDSLNDLSAGSSRIAGIVLLRGGDDNTLDIWNDVEVLKLVMELDTPFYTAMGHANRITMINKYADQSFHTPSAFGNILFRSLEIDEEQLKLRKEVAQLRSELSRVNHEWVIKEEADNPYLKDSPQIKKSHLWSWILLAVVITSAVVVSLVMVFR